MTLYVDLQALAGNAAHAKAVAAANGASLVGVLKRAYARPRIVKAFVDGGASLLGLSAPAPRLAGVDRQNKWLTFPAPANAARAIVDQFSVSTVSNPAAVRALGRAARKNPARHALFIAARTSEEREGLRLGDRAFEIIVREAKTNNLEIAGVLANFGCVVEAAPQPSELDAIRALADALHDEVKHDIAVSMGGSVLLPQLCNIRLGAHALSLRVGEAILAGTIPGHAGDGALKAPFSFEARVLEARGERLLIDAGWTSFDPADARLDGARIAHASAECAVVMSDQPYRRPPRVIELKLGFKSIIKALLNPATRIRWM